MEENATRVVSQPTISYLPNESWCAYHACCFWGFRLHARVAPDGTPGARELRPPRVDEKAVALTLLKRAQRHGGEVMIGDKNYRGREFTAQVAQLGPMILRLRPARRTRERPAHHANPATDRVDLLDLQTS